MQKWFLVILGLVVSLVGTLRAEPVDGLWNGKPWKIESLKAGVEKRDPAALAEWAYCSREVWGGIKFDEAQIFSYAEQAEKRGSLLGAAILSRCYLFGKGVERDVGVGLELARIGAVTGHPLGVSNFANCHFDGVGGFALNFKKGRELMEKAIAGGCVIARANRFLHGRNQFGGVIMTRPEVAKEAAAVLNKYNGIAAAHMILSLSNDGLRGPVLTEEIVNLAEARVREAVTAGHLDSMTSLGVYYTYKDRENEGLPLILKAAGKPSGYRSGTAFDYAQNRFASKRGNSAGPFTSVYRLAREAFVQGKHRTIICQYVVNSYLFWWEGKPLQPELAIPALEILKKTRFRGAREAIGRFYGTSKNNSHYDQKRAAANLVYAIGNRPVTLELLSQIQLLGKPEKLDRVRGYATLIRGLEESPTKWLRGSKPLVEKKMTPAQLAESADLIKRNYPVAEEFQREAITALLEYGDLPEGSTFENAGDD